MANELIVAQYADTQGSMAIVVFVGLLLLGLLVALRHGSEQKQRDRIEKLLRDRDKQGRP